MIRALTVYTVLFFTKLFYRHKVYGKKRIPKGAALVAANHASFLDPPLVGISCPDAVHFLARDTLFKPPAFAWYLRKLKAHPVARGRENVGAIRTMCELLKDGKKVAIFPEGTRTTDGELKKGQHGVAMLVLRAKVPVVPVYVAGTYEIWGIHQKSPKLSGKTACVFGKPLDFSSVDTTDKKRAEKEITEAIMEAIGALKAWYEAGAKGTPP